MGERGCGVRLVEMVRVGLLILFLEGGLVVMRMSGLGGGGG